MNDRSFDLEALKWVTGPLYTQKRDEWLARTPDARSILSRMQEERDWRTSITATILLGWLDHRGAYDALVHELDEVKWENKTYAQSILGPHAVWDVYANRAEKQPEFGRMVLPLCLEVVLKRHGEWSWHKTRTFFFMLMALRDEQSIEPLLWYLEYVASDRDERHVAASTLGAFPAEPLRSRIAKLYAEQGQTREALETELDDKHLPDRTRP